MVIDVTTTCDINLTSTAVPATIMVERVQIPTFACGALSDIGKDWHPSWSSV